MPVETVADVGALDRCIAHRYAPAHDLAVVTTYFNPCKYKSRLLNYKLFKSFITASELSLFTVECAFGNSQFELDGDAGVLQFRSSSVLWQKERLLNHAVNAWLPRRFTKIAWIDCDLLFANASWAVETSRLLDLCPVAQVFDFVDRLPSGWKETGTIGDISRSFASVLQDGAATRRDSWEAHGHTGYGWAARRGMFEACGLYEACILGNGDHLMAHAFTGEPGVSCVTRRYRDGDPQLEHYREWAGRAYGYCRADVRCVPGTVYHLWHGERENRRYLERQEELNAIGYDPFSDVRVDRDGCLVWCSDKPALHALAVSHFSLRREDG